MMQSILLVDDEDSIQLLYREELEEEGFSVHSAFSGEEGLEKIRHTKFDLVILDINMPGMSGLEALKKMKEFNPALPVIINSAYQEFMKDLTSYAADEFLVKGANLNELKSSIRRHISAELP